MLLFRAGSAEAVVGAIRAVAELKLEDLADEGLRAAVPAGHVHGAEPPPETRSLVAELEVPGPLAAGFRALRIDPVGRKGEPGRVVDQAAFLGDRRLASVPGRGE